MTNEEVFVRAYDEVRLRGLSPKTVESYLGRLKLFLKYFNEQAWTTFVTGRCLKLYTVQGCAYPK